MIRAVLFDLDGVLVDTRECHYTALNVALVENGFARIELKQHNELYNGLPTARKLEMLVERGLVTRDSVDRVILSKNKYTTKLLTHVKFDPNIFCLLAGLCADDFQIGVVSNAIRPTVNAVCTKLRVLEFVDIITSNEEGPPKPDPFLYRLACDRLKVPSHEVLAVEDGKYGIESAKRAGCRVLAVSGPCDVTPERVWEAMC